MFVEEQFQVVVSDREERYSIWPQPGADLPEGWRTAGHSGTRAECLAYIDRVWKPHVVTATEAETL